MKYLALTLLLLSLLPLPAEARKRKPVRKAKRKITRTAPVVCPPCVQNGCPDKVITLTQAEQDVIDSRRARVRVDFERSFAEWLARQPNMSPAAASVLRETARVWYSRGKGEVIQK